MSIKIAICDDSEVDLKKLTESLLSYDSSFDIQNFTSGEVLYDEILDLREPLDLLFLDIYMANMNGIETAQKLRREMSDLKIIFISSSNDHYSEAYDVFAYNYLLKPIDETKLFAVLDRALNEIKQKNLHKIQFSYKSKTYHVNSHEICYIESRDKQILFHMTYGQTLMCYGKLDDFTRTLPSHKFIRCHQSYIVNAEHITEMGSGYFYIKQSRVNISKKHLKVAKEQYYNYLFSSMGRGPRI